MIKIAKEIKKLILNNWRKLFTFSPAKMSNFLDYVITAAYFMLYFTGFSKETYRFLRSKESS